MLETILTRLAESPVLVEQSQEIAFLANFKSVNDKMVLLSVEDREAMNALESADYDEDFWPDDDSPSFVHSLRPYDVQGGVLVVPVKGSLVSNLGITLFGMVTGYTYIEKAVERGMADDDVHTILFNTNSPGGDVSQNFDLVDYIASQRGQGKTFISAAADHAYSAAFNIAAAADRRYVDRVGGVGSVGVVMMHVDISEMLKKMGMKVDLIHSGEHKVDGNSFKPMKPEVRKRFQARVDALRQMFVSTVAANLAMDEQAVWDTQALTYTAEESLEVGFADEIKGFRAILSDEKTQAQPGATIMSEQSKTPQASGQGQGASSTETNIDAARQQAHESGKEEGYNSGFSEGAKAERERIGGILGCEEAKSKPQAARTMALRTDQSVDQAKAALADFPEEAKASSGGGSHFETAMVEGNPNVQGDENGDDGSQMSETDKDIAALSGAYASETGEKPNA